MIYPTRRAIYLLLAGAPLALPLGLIRPELWLVAPGWIGVIIACLILDTIAGANPRHLALDARFPHQVGVGDPFELSLTAKGRAVPPRAELALALDERLAEGGRLAGDMRSAGETLVRTLSLTASRRGQAGVEALWIRSDEHTTELQSLMIITYFHTLSLPDALPIFRAISPSMRVFRIRLASASRSNCRSPRKGERCPHAPNSRSRSTRGSPKADGWPAICVVRAKRWSAPSRSPPRGAGRRGSRRCGSAGWGRSGVGRASCREREGQDV